MSLEILLLGTYTLRIVCILGVVTPLSLCNVSLSLIAFLALESALSKINSYSCYLLINVSMAYLSLALYVNNKTFLIPPSCPLHHSCHSFHLHLAHTIKYIVAMTVLNKLRPVRAIKNEKNKSFFTFTYTFSGTLPFFM